MDNNKRKTKKKFGEREVDWRISWIKETEQKPLFIPKIHWIKFLFFLYEMMIPTTRGGHLKQEEVLLVIKMNLKETRKFS